MSLLSIIPTSLSQLQEHYPEVVKSYMSHTSLILEHVEIIDSKMPPFFGSCTCLLIHNNICSKFQTFYRVMSSL